MRRAFADSFLRIDSARFGTLSRTAPGCQQTPPSLPSRAAPVTVSAFTPRGAAGFFFLVHTMLRPFRGKHPQVAPTAFIEESAQVIGDVHIGDESSVWFNAVVRGDVFHIRIGDRTNVQDGTVIRLQRHARHYPRRR